MIPPNPLGGSITTDDEVNICILWSTLARGCGNYCKTPCPIASEDECTVALDERGGGDGGEGVVDGRGINVGRDGGFAYLVLMWWWLHHGLFVLCVMWWVWECLGQALTVSDGWANNDCQ